MRTNDFSNAPASAQAGVVFYGGTRYSGPGAMLGLALRWPRVGRVMRSAEGYMGHHVWFRFPFTIGTVSFWETPDHLRRFAASPAHREATNWMLQPGVADAAFIRYLTPVSHGNALGAWSAAPDA